MGSDAKVRTSIVASLLINVSAVAVRGRSLTPVTGALWHNLGSVFVVVNAALLLQEGLGRPQMSAATKGTLRNTGFDP